MKKRILYRSTNRELKAGFKKTFSFKDALFMGMAPDKGLFMPTKIPKLTKKEIMGLRGKPYHEVAYHILKKFLTGVVKDKDLKAMTKDAYNFKIPIEKLDENIFIARLDRGPTASFKDFAARMMARLMEKLKQNNKYIIVLVATSGDTGSAVGDAYRGLKGIKVIILYPKKEVSKIQKKQLDSIGKNVSAISVDGKFDDCQKIVKEAFSDEELKKLNLTSANSINIGRIIPQIIYYFYMYINTVEQFKQVIFSVPSGNLGNSLGCEIARRMGLPVKTLIIATNENNEVPVLLKTGKYKVISPSKVCLSNAMNVGNPSNLARYFNLYSGTVDKEGITHKKPKIQNMKSHLYSISISNSETVKTIDKMYKKYKTIVEPHGAVGIAALIKYNDKKTTSICVETADPAKFPEIIKKTLKISPKIPNTLKKINKRKGKADKLKNDYKKFKEYLLKKR